MPLPALTETGDLPPGVYPASIEEVAARFGSGTSRRKEVTQRLLYFIDLARRTMMAERLIVLGSYVTAKPAPNDVDVILVMHDDFQWENRPADTAALFDHARADQELGASILWVRPSMVLRESFETFLARWQMTRTGGQRGVVEIRL